MTNETLSAGEIRRHSVSKDPVLSTAPYVDVLNIRTRMHETQDTLSEETLIAVAHAWFHVQMEYLSQSYEYGGIMKTLIQYEEDWIQSEECLRHSKAVFDLIHPRKTKDGYSPSDDAIIKSVRVKCRELGEIRGLILKHLQRCWNNKAIQYDKQRQTRR